MQMVEFRRRLLPEVLAVADRHGVQFDDLFRRGERGGLCHTLRLVAVRREVAVNFRADGYSYPAIGLVLGMHHTSIMAMLRRKRGCHRDDLSTERRKVT